MGKEGSFSRRAYLKSTNHEGALGGGDEVITCDSERYFGKRGGKISPKREGAQAVGVWAQGAVWESV
jgi:hypothetical protein